MLSLAPLFIGYPTAVQAPPTGREVGASRASRESEDRIAGLLNAYRRSLGLPPVPRSASLDRVARAHVADLVAHRPDRERSPAGRSCNLHSWSAHGPWTPVCYTGDHAGAAMMWSKPREITDGAYPGYGFEIAMMSGGEPILPAEIVAGWRASAAHDAVIAERGVWRGMAWKAMGVGIAGDYAVVWFGVEPDAAKR